MKFKFVLAIIGVLSTGAAQHSSADSVAWQGEQRLRASFENLFVSPASVSKPQASVAAKSANSLQRQNADQQQVARPIIQQRHWAQGIRHQAAGPGWAGGEEALMLLGIVVIVVWFILMAVEANLCCGQHF
ncbi:MAG: hypothetical protein HY401_08930 [Elusimicrobia bacterium]|nr:hypothetical protein [Elusimicrobiota bacterium]